MGVTGSYELTRPEPARAVSSVPEGTGDAETARTVARATKIAEKRAIMMIINLGLVGSESGCGKGIEGVVVPENPMRVAYQNAASYIPFACPLYQWEGEWTSTYSPLRRMARVVGRSMTLKTWGVTLKNWIEKHVFRVSVA